MIIAIDPGNIKSAIVHIDEETCRPCGKLLESNDMVLETLIATLENGNADHVVIEMVASYGMPVGREVFDTCVWIGRFTQAAEERMAPVSLIYRQEEKLRLCHDSRAKDVNIRRALIERFAEHDHKRGVGTKKEPDWFYGFHADLWAAYAVGVTWLDKQKEAEHADH